MAIVIIVIVLLLFVLYLLAIRGRRGNPAWETLTKYRYAHRGLHDKEHGIPENSLAAFRRAVEHGYGAELDVHLTKDGRLAVIHDDSLLRTAGADVKASELTAAELRQYRLEGTSERIPFLDEVLPLFAGKTPLIVELKVEKNAGKLAKAACELLDQYQVDYCIESFHPKAVMWLKQYRPDICRGQLSQNFLKDPSGLNLPAAFVMTHLLTGCVAAPDFIAYNLHHRKRLSIKLARKIWGVREVSWTIRTPEELAACEKDGCLSIFEHFMP
jgi:glycerophosphoryl diester phosphodiesterase